MAKKKTKPSSAKHNASQRREPARKKPAAKKHAAKNTAGSKKAGARVPSTRKKATSRIAAKPAAKAKAKPPARPSKSVAASTDPRPANTGTGPTPFEIGLQVVNDFNSGKAELNDTLWAPSIVSVEGMGVNLAWHGRAAVDAKNQWWSSTHRVHGASAEGPYVGSTGFAIKFVMDVEDTATGKRETMTEIGVYTVENGKIVREEFMYACW
ncbi:MAG: nuclear transport factor 2 family protein [Phycisphaeraceae bacterium]|nr:nuclear transport factor 2 family protein [Phycisphaeraceae bacterium]